MRGGEVISASSAGRAGGRLPDLVEQVDKPGAGRAAGKAPEAKSNCCNIGFGYGHVVKSWNAGRSRLAAEERVSGRVAAKNQEKSQPRLWPFHVPTATPGGAVMAFGRLSLRV